jgi:hypothetical protein
MTDFKVMKDVFFEKLFTKLESKCTWQHLTPEIIISTLCETLIDGLRKNGRFSEDRKFRKFFSLCENCKDGKKLFMSLNNPNPPINALPCYSQYFELMRKEDFSKLPLDQQIPLSILDLVGYLPRVKLGYLYSSFGVNDERVPVDLSKKTANPPNRKGATGKKALKVKDKDNQFSDQIRNLPQQSNENPVFCLLSETVKETPRDKTVDEFLIPSKIVSFPKTDRRSPTKTKSANEVKRKVDGNSEGSEHRTNKRLKLEETNLLPVDRYSLWKRYYDVLIGYQEQTGHFQVFEETQVESENGDIFSLGKWLQFEKKKLNFYFEYYPKKFTALSNWFENELMDSTSEKEMRNPAPKSPDKENHFTDDSQTLATADSSLLSMAAPTVTTNSSGPCQPIFQARQTSTSTVKNIQLVAFEYQKDFRYYLGLGKFIQYSGNEKKRMIVLQKYIVCDAENAVESLMEESNERIEIPEAKIFANKSKDHFIQFTLTVNNRSKSICFPCLTMIIPSIFYYFFLNLSR